MSRMLITIIIISTLALLVDVYIYRRVIRRHNFGRWWKIGYIIYALLVDTAIITAMSVYRHAVDAESSTLLRGVMWVIGIFFLNSTPKIIYAVISLGDYVVQAFTRRTSHWFGYTGSALAAIVAVAMLYGMTIGRSNIRVETVELHFADLPASFDGMRVVQFSDNHLGTLMGRDAFLERMVRTINGLSPDVVVNSGDLVNSHAEELDDRAMEILSGIKPSIGVYSVLGNHDLGIYISDTSRMSASESVRRLVAKQKAMGWRVLGNSSEVVSNGRDSILVSGLNYPVDVFLNGRGSEVAGADIEAMYADTPDSLFSMVISHTPAEWDALLGDGRADLTMSGHVHAMQMKFHVGPRGWSPAKWVYPRWSGLYREGDKYLYVNDGMGYVMYPIRLGTRPELTLFVLRSGRSGGSGR